jgi:hypothetical protein
MAIKTSYNALVMVNAVDLSNHCISATVSDGAASNDITCMGNTYHVFRPGLSNASITCVFKNDHASGSVESTLRGLTGISSTGFDVYVRYDNSARTTDNPEWYMIAIVDGEINLMDDKIGEVPEITAKFVPYSTFTVYTSAS